MGVIHPRLAFVAVEIFKIFCFLAHNFGSTYARKPLKSSKDADHSLVFKENLSQKYGSLGWGPGPGKVGPKVAKTCPHCDVIHRKLQTKNEKFFFQSQLKDLLNPLML